MITNRSNVAFHGGTDIPVCGCHWRLVRQCFRNLPLALITLSLFGSVAPSPAAEREAAWKRHTIDASSRGADGVRLEDVNGDGLPDIATGWEEGGIIRVCLNPGPKQAKHKWPAVTVGKVKSPEDAVFVDLDHDGATDVVSCCEGRTETMFVHWAPRKPADYLNSQAWQTAAIPATEGRSKWMFCVPLQLDKQHGVDLVVGSKGGSEGKGMIGWLQAPADPRQLDDWKLHRMYKAGWIMSLVALDIDGDGDHDILASDRKGAGRGCLWLENPGASAEQTAPWAEHRIGTGNREVMFLDVADLDGDGLQDIIVPNRQAGILFHRRVSRRPVAWQTTTINRPAGTGSGKAIAVADIDGDGRQDLVLSCGLAKGNEGVIWMSYDGLPTDATWRSHTISGLVGAKFDLVKLIDLDNDGDLDVLTCEERTNLGVFWYENPTR